MGATYTDADRYNLLSQPGIWSYRNYGSAGAWTEAVLANGASWNITPEIVPIEFDDAGTVQEEVADETVDISVSMGQVLNMDAVEALGGGLWTKSTVAAAPVVGAGQVKASGSWAYSTPWLLINDANGYVVNNSGVTPTITSITGSTDGAIVEDTDFFLTWLEGSGWAIVIIDSATVTTLDQSMTVVMTYTPFASTTLKRGGIKVVTPIEMKFSTLDPNNLTVDYIFYKVFSQGTFGHGFSPENDAQPILSDMTFSAKKDTSRASTDQLMRIDRQTS